ncbi:carboxylesterase/lipase family protein [Pseudomaricurvus alkylphenolicus]|uniref:carboxylesterase/lipase family protein n=1 Tax=Pseudomaricurvus alkylphenolicus TaxID=1306991 RepID=UPI0014221CE1|nr:carboxylesterase/lipase family protein [Pseudomaricurvus alkylphenolicus]NIB38179.1 carboxylesterase/lipase family protein [Pseudomaricurvus alkylphenolicus]
MQSVVKTANGRIAGVEENGVAVFRGIPYAQPPFGGNLFKPPVLPEPWEGEFVADSYGATVPQVKAHGYFGDLCSPKYPAGDDCLNLNIYTPDTEARNLPVYVWIHGGGFFMGCNSDEVYDGSSFARDGIVTVTINYRLGALGYMHLADYFPSLNGSDNLGQRDQIAALQWVRDNIRAFGGDPDNVTIGGESAGGMAVATLLAMPEAKGLFKRAILQSQALPNSLSRDEANNITSLMMERLGIERGDTEALCKLQIEDILQTQTELSEELLDPAGDGKLEKFGVKCAVGYMAFLPVHGTDSLPVSPNTAVQQGFCKDIDVLIGYTKDESSLFMVDTSTAFFNPEVARLSLQAALGEESESLLHRYQSNHQGISDFEFCIRIESDKMFSAITHIFTEYQAANSDNVWMYRFDWETPQMEGRLGAHHFLEVPFTFNRMDNWQADSLIGDCKPYDVSTTIHNYWVAFIKTGDPNNTSCPTWPRYNNQRGEVMLFNTTFEVKPWPMEREVIDIWKHSVLM